LRRSVRKWHLKTREHNGAGRSRKPLPDAGKYIRGGYSLRFAPQNQRQKAECSPRGVIGVTGDTSFGRLIGKRIFSGESAKNT
jgi:hypothetical protein